MSYIQPDVKARTGERIEPGQTWVSEDESFEAYVIGFSKQGWPVVELSGPEGRMPLELGYMEIEKFWKSMFLYKLKE